MSNVDQSTSTTPSSRRVFLVSERSNIGNMVNMDVDHVDQSTSAIFRYTKYDAPAKPATSLTGQRPMLTGQQYVPRFNVADVADVDWEKIEHRIHVRMRAREADVG